MKLAGSHCYLSYVNVGNAKKLLAQAILQNLLCLKKQFRLLAN